MNIYYIYAYVRSNGTPYYIGKGTSDRAWSKKHAVKKPKDKSRIIIMETGADEKYTSYTVNKGERIVFCLRAKLINTIHDLNTLMYVVIHELAHVGCPEFGHTPLFREIFKFLLIESVKINIYTPIDYRKYPKNYCGMEINEYLLD